VADDPYEPIACALHDRYERALIMGIPVRLVWRDAEHEKTAKVRIRAIETARSEEFVCFTDALGADHRIRLDRIAFADRP